MKLVATVVLLLCLLSGSVRCQNLVTTDGCGTTKGCTHYPLGCTSPACDAILSWKPNSDMVSVDFELMATTDGWVAASLSLDTLMTNDSLVYCLNNNSVGLGFTPGQYVEYNFSDSMIGLLSNVSNSYINGQIHCRYTRLISAAGRSWKIYSLDQQYYLFLGLGPLDSTTGLLAKHRKDPYVSLKAVDVTVDTSDIVYVTRPPSGGSAPVPTEQPNGGRFELSNNKAKMTYVVDADNIDFQIWGPAGSTWVAVGFSDDQHMGDDCVIACSINSSGAVAVKHWYNNGFNCQPVNDPTQGITEPSASVISGAIYCQFKQQMSLSLPSKTCDLRNAFYLLLGYGPADGTGVIMKHNDNPEVSANQINVTALTAVNNVASSSVGKSINILKAHGCLMITAWILLVSPSILLARYFKTAFPGDKICATAVWFAVHRFLMLIALFCTLVGFIIIFIYVGDTGRQMAPFNPAYPGYFWVHGPLGIIVMILVIANPAIAAARCGPDSKFRPIFNWIHWIVGTSCYIIAMITIFFGAKMGEAPDANLHISHIAIFWILIAFTAYHCLTEMLLIIHKFMEEDILKRRVNINQEYELTSSGHAKHKPKPDEATVGGLIFRYVLLGLYGIVTLGLWLAMIILIGSGNVG
jgi:hypothetical protein